MYGFSNNEIKSTLLLMTVPPKITEWATVESTQCEVLYFASKNIEAHPMTFTKTINMGHIVQGITL
jgi:hypothetical protein